MCISAITAVLHFVCDSCECEGGGRTLDSFLSIDIQCSDSYMITCASVKGSYDCTRSGRLEDVPEKTIVFLALTQITAFRPKQKVILWRSSVAQHEAGIIFFIKSRQNFLLTLFY